MNGFLSQLGGLPQVLWSNLAGTVQVRARKIIVGTGLVLTDNADSTATLTASGGSGNVATDTIWDAKGDLAVGTGADTAAKLGVGSDAQVLTADSAQTTGVKWAAAGSGTVTSVAMTVPADMAISGSPVTTSGTLAVTRSAQSGNKVMSSPSDGSSGTPAFRALVAGDIPAIAESGVTSLTTDLGLKAPLASPTFTGTTTAPEFSASGLTGAVSASRYVGATASVAPTTGTFALGDFVITQTGKIYVCTVAGSPGTWTQVGAGGAASMTIQEVDTSPSVSATTLIFPNGTLTDNGGGSVTYTPASGGSAFAPWLVDIVPSSEPSATTGTWVFLNTGDIQGPFSTSLLTNASPGSGAQNDALSWDVVLSAGTWTAIIHCRKSSNTGIFTLNQDGSSMGTADSYNASAAIGKLTISGWTVSTDGKHTMQLKMATKNGSSSGYLGELFAVSLRRTA